MQVRKCDKWTIRAEREGVRGLGMGPSYVYASYRRNYCTSDNTTSLTDSVTNGRDKRHAGLATTLGWQPSLDLRTGLSEQPSSALDTLARGSMGFQTRRVSLRAVPIALFSWPVAPSANQGPGGVCEMPQGGQTNTSPGRRQQK